MDDLKELEHIDLFLILMNIYRNHPAKYYKFINENVIPKAIENLNKKQMIELLNSVEIVMGSRDGSFSEQLSLAL